MTIAECACAEAKGSGLGSVGMDANQPGLFSRLATDPPGTANRLSRGGTADVGVTQPLPRSPSSTRRRSRKPRPRPQRRRSQSNCRPIGDVDGAEPETAHVAPTGGVFDALGWLIWPTDGVEDLLEADAVRFVSAVSDVVAESDDRCTVTWTVAVKLTDVDELRRIAVEAQPDAAGLIADSLAVAWQHAADPFEPLRSIPGIDWLPVQVRVEHLSARQRNTPESEARGDCVPGRAPG